MKKLAFLPLVLLLSGCAGWFNKPPIRVVAEPLPAVIAPVPAPITTRPVTWQVLTVTDLQNIISQQETNPDPNFVLYALDNGNFQALNLNLIEIRRFVLEQQQTIQFYKKIEADANPEPESAPRERRCFLIICL
jgi:hypothetical protein